MRHLLVENIIVKTIDPALHSGSKKCTTREVIIIQHSRGICLFSQTTVFTRSSLSSSTSRTSIDSPSPPNEHCWTDTTAARQPFVPLGKWYRTQDKRSRERDGGSCDATGGGCHAPHGWYYYPYKPAHVSRQPAEEKRLYGVLDARCLFGGRGRRPVFRVPTPRAKPKTAVRPDGSVVHTTTTYKCKFVPLARLHENNRTYGPILSSLPVVVSR